MFPSEHTDVQTIPGGDSAVKLLTKFGLLEAAVAYATESL